MKEDEAWRQYSEIQKYYHAQLNHEQQLLSFRQEYRAQLSKVSESPVNALILQQYDLFVAGLDSGIIDQKTVTSAAHDKLKIATENYITCKKKSDSLKKVLESEELKERVRLEKIEQKENDEYARNIWLNRRESE